MKTKINELGLLEPKINECFIFNGRKLMCIEDSGLKNFLCDGCEIDFYSDCEKIACSRNVRSDRNFVHFVEL